ncbi:MAG: helix-hairpin-helix domain-containing protein [Actinomycetes bacterium]
MWTRGRGATDRVAAAGAVRLEHLARQWRIPAPPSATPTTSETPATAWQLLAEDGSPPPDSTPAPGLATGPWNRSAIRGLVVLVLVAVLLASWWWWSGRPREAIAAPTILATGGPVAGAGGPSASAVPGVGAPGGPAVSPPAAPVREVVVHVVGQVRHPGLVTLPVGSRVNDAITAAGGVTRPRAGDSVNLARVLVDGEQVVVGFAAQAVAGVLGIAPVKSGGLLNLNSADATAFEDLPGVGPVLAQRIVQWRVANGPFRSVDELGEVTGIGDAIMAQLRPLVSV